MRCCSPTSADRLAHSSRSRTGRAVLSAPRRCPNGDAPAPQTGPTTSPANADTTAKHAKPHPAAPHPPPPTTSRRPSRRADLLLGRDHSHHDQCEDAEDQSEDAPTKWVAALHPSNYCANNRRDNAADGDENAFDAAQNKSCGLCAARGLTVVLRSRIPAKAEIKPIGAVQCSAWTCAARGLVMGR